MKTTLPKLKALYVHECSPVHCVDELLLSICLPNTNPASAYPPSFVGLAQKIVNQPMRLQINCSLKIAKYFELLLHQYGRVATYNLRKSFTYPSSNKCD